MTADTKYLGYARETALCVDLAYVAMEEDILTELNRGPGDDRAALARVLKRLRERRAALGDLVEITGVPR